MCCRRRHLSWITTYPVSWHYHHTSGRVTGGCSSTSVSCYWFFFHNSNKRLNNGILQHSCLVTGMLVIETSSLYARFPLLPLAMYTYIIPLCVCVYVCIYMYVCVYNSTSERDLFTLVHLAEISLLYIVLDDKIAIYTLLFVFGLPRRCTFGAYHSRLCASTVRSLYRCGI